MSPRMSIRKRLFFSHFLAVLLVSGSIGSYFYHSAHQSLLTSLQSRLQNSAALAASVLDASYLVRVRAEGDTERQEYARTLDLLRAFRSTNPDIAYLYVMRRNPDGGVCFVVDSDATEDQAKPGQIYPDPPTTLMSGFVRPWVDDHIYQDAWGSFLSGYAPLPRGQGSYLVGLDMRADEVAEKFRMLRLSGLVSLAASVLLAALFSQMLSRHFTVPLRTLAGHMRRLSLERPGEPIALRSNDELDDVIGAYNTMASRLAESRSQRDCAQQALAKAYAEQEVRVTERTSDLQQAKDRLEREVAVRRRAEAALAQAALSDPLTGLANRRAIAEHAEHELARCRREQGGFALVLADLDRFKSVNDRFGHHGGDALLKAVARALEESVREQDVVARWGGEEFLVLLPSTDLEGGRVLAEKLRRRIAALRVPELLGPGIHPHDDETDAESLDAASEEPPRLSLSAGVSAWTTETGPARIDQLIRDADHALYAAKRLGRNRVQTTADLLGPALRAEAVDTGSQG